VIVLRGLRKRLGARDVLAGIDLEVPRGQFVTIFGPNGAGKTTLLRILSGLMRPSGGDVYLGGARLEDDSVALRAMVGVVSHHTYLYDDLTALENLVFYGKMYGVKDAPERARRLLEEVGLSVFAHDPVRTFSRGMQQKLAIARAVIHEPEVLLADEPYTGLDRRAGEVLTGLLRRFKERGVTILMVNHDFDQGVALADRVIILAGGRVALDELVTSESLRLIRERYEELVGGKYAGVDQKQ